MTDRKLNDNDSSRRLATIRKISALTPILDADKIEVATVDGWQVVCQKGLYEVGDLCVYLEIDSWVPHEVAPFLTKPGHEPKEYNGIQGQRLKTVRLKKQLSQGLLLPMEQKMDGGYLMPVTRRCNVTEGEDVTDELNITKWEREIPAQLRGMMKGNFPHFIRKTDQERVQNLNRTLEKWSQEDTLWEVTEKLDGSSMTVYLKDGVFGVCSRNIDLKVEDTANAFVAMALKLKLNEKMPIIRGNWAIQGELCGPGIQKNYYELSEHEFFVYDMWDIDNQRYLDCEFTRSMAKHMNLRAVPLITVQTLKDETVETILNDCQGTSFLINKPAEGVVFKCLDNDNSFKAINNEWLLKNE